MNKHKVVEKLIGWSVPFLNLFRKPEPWPYKFDDLLYLEQGTLGRELHQFLQSRNLGYLPKYEEHDAYHALLGYGTTVTEELKLQSFMWGNKNATFAGKVLFILGYILFPSKHDEFRREVKRGMEARPLCEYDVASMIPLQLDELRRNLCIS
ncbi:hypothetical protein [Pseudoalteromonas sp. PPB1]|uniref:hypothetical protein n=1 Tax=Pseudoalteromonas sp. PPB1 TaxID=2756136 RepID=UPI001891EDB0|nr:hypothetical protein [Pseudoalteromonas sp. PPB1]